MGIGPKIVRGYLKKADGTPIPGNQVAARINSVILTCLTESDGLYTVTFGPSDWSNGDTIEAGSTFEGKIVKNTTIADDSPIQYIDLTIPEFSYRYLVRSGSCNNCGVCCEGCKKFINGSCSSYATRPIACKVFPIHPYHLGTEWQESCSYRFYDSGSGERIVYTGSRGSIHTDVRGGINWKYDSFDSMLYGYLPVGVTVADTTSGRIRFTINLG